MHVDLSKLPPPSVTLRKRGKGEDESSNRGFSMGRETATMMMTSTTTTWTRRVREMATTTSTRVWETLTWAWGERTRFMGEGRGTESVYTPPIVAQWSTRKKRAAFAIAFLVLMVLVWGGLKSSSSSGGEGRGSAFRAALPSVGLSFSLSGCPSNPRMLGALELRASKNANSVPGHTGSGALMSFEKIVALLGKVDRDALEHFGAAEPLTALEGKCGWNATTRDFLSTQIGSCPLVEGMKFRIDDVPELPVETVAKLVDVLVVASANGDVAFLDAWKDVLAPYHIIIVNRGPRAQHVSIPSWADFEMLVLESVLEGLPPPSPTASSFGDLISDNLLNLGLLASKKQFVVVLSEECTPARDTATRIRVDPVAAHVRNLLTNSTPYYFNPTQDPYGMGGDFARGTPYSLRDGVRTVISQGSVVGDSEWDALTRILKRGTRPPLGSEVAPVEIAQTIPTGSLYSMTLSNVGLLREVLGPALYFPVQGLGQPWGRYEDVLTGWVAKTCADAVGLGFKSGTPYVVRARDVSPFADVKAEFQGMAWQETLLSFFARIRISAKASKSVKACYREVAGEIAQNLATLHPYFEKLSGRMISWLALWEEVQSGRVALKPSRIGKPPSTPPPPQLSGKCQTPATRYSTCMDILTRPVSQRRTYFRQLALEGEASEVVLIRWTSEVVKSFAQDAWLSVCALLTEATGLGGAKNRHAYLLVPAGSEGFIPPEYQPLVRVFDDEDLRKLFRPEVYVSSHVHGADLGVGWWMKSHPVYEFAWVLESDTRYVGDFDELFRVSKALAASQIKLSRGDVLLATYSSTSPSPDLVVWDPPAIVARSPALKTMGLLAPTIDHNQKAPVLVAAGLMGFGISRKFALEIVRHALQGTYATTQEVNLPALALFQRRKFVNVLSDVVSAFGTFDCCTAVGKTAYGKWKASTTRPTSSACVSDQLFYLGAATNS